MHRFVAPTVAFLLLALLALATTTAVAQNIPGAAARVNGVEISNFRLERHFEEYLRSQRRSVTAMINPKVYKKLKREALDQLIERELLWQAARAEGKVATDAEVQKALQEMVAQMKGGREAYLRRLAQAGFDEASYAEYVRQELSGAAWLLRRAGETTRQVARLVVIDVDGRADALRPRGRLERGLLQSSPHQVADRLRPVGVLAVAHELVEAGHQVVVERNRRALHVRSSPVDARGRPP